MLAEGLSPKVIVPDTDGFQRFATSKNGKDLDGFYKLTIGDEGIAFGVFGCWRQQISKNWNSRSGVNALSLAEHMELKQQIEARMSEAREQRAEMQKSGQTHASAIFNNALYPKENHPYLLTKGIKPLGDIRMVETPAFGQQLLIPVFGQDGLISSLQYINEDGKKTFLAHGKVVGGFFYIGRKPKKADDIICVCEGYATACTIAQAFLNRRRNVLVVIAFNAGNLKPVAQYLRLKYPRQRIAILADNDKYSVKNVGLACARDAANEVNGTVIYPHFGNKYDSNPTDFNDLAKLEGIEVVEKQLGDLITLDVNFPDVNTNGKILGTLDNFRALLQHKNIDMHYNVINKNTNIMFCDGQMYSVDNEANVKIAKLRSLANLYNFPREEINYFIQAIADENPYNPVANWVLSKSWDGVHRFNKFLETITTEPDYTATKDVLIKKWMMAALATALEARGIGGFYGVLTLSGHQGVGKTRWIASLAPSDLDLIGGEKRLDVTNKDSVLECISKWITELGELDSTFKKSDVSALKAFITRSVDVIRRPYMAREASYMRRTVFAASVNGERFLADETGNRRYWTIPVVKADYNHEFDMQQVWAELWHEYENYSGNKSNLYILTREEGDSVDAMNQTCELREPLEEVVESKLDWKAPKALWEWKLTTHILEDLGFPANKLSRSEINKVSRAVTRFNSNQKKRYNNGWRYLVPPVLRQDGGNFQYNGEFG